MLIKWGTAIIICICWIISETLDIEKSANIKNAKYIHMNHNAAHQHERERYNSRREKNP